ncbi:class I SAM-dependent methyltransferase [Gemmatimonas sp.]|uniref:class I SAM-dependent methyltransferase n=1 Tax=Gemmatimonas sp. TaxID=1962908 RepID=UPI00286DC549|nr:class I SAM-dependent methyltransferase [Gemmatimonas sp.]
MPGAVPRDAAFFDDLYRTHADPWGYRQAAEQSKYHLTLRAARRWQPRPRRVLDVGCSLGYLTEMLADYAPRVSAFDISPTAIRMTQDRCAARRTSTAFDIQLGDALAPAYPRGHFDVVFAGDVLLGAFDGAERAVRAVRALLPLLSANGVLIATDFMNPTAQQSYVNLVETAGGRIREALYFNDRYWFRLKTALKSRRDSAWGQRLLCSPRVFQFLAHRAARRGPAGSKHFGLVVQPVA